MRSNLHLCCNQLEGIWEVRTREEIVVYKGSIEQCQIYIEMRDNK